MSNTIGDIFSTLEQYVDCTIKYIDGGYCSIVSKEGKEVWRDEMLPDQVDNLKMHQRRAKISLEIKARTVVEGDVKTITLHTGDKVYWTDGDEGTDDTVLEDLGEQVVVKSKNNCGEYITLSKERVKFKGVKCLQRKVWA